MKLEREAKFEVGHDFRMPDLSSLDDAMRGEVGTTERFVSTYHDTDDLRLVRWGASLRYRTTEGWAVKLPRSVEGSIVVRQEHTFDGGPGRPPAEASDLVRGLVRGGATGPVVRLQTIRHRMRVTRTADDRLVSEVVDDEVSVLEGRRIVERFREIEVELADDVDPSAIAPIVDLLADAGVRISEPIPKVVRALGARAQAPPDVFVSDVGPSSTVEEVVRWAIAMSTRRLMQHDPVVRLGVDPEGVHQTRVATRRIRSDLRTFRSLLERDWRDELRGELGWLGAELGGVRDCDVLGERLREDALLLPDDDATNVSKVLDRLRARHDAARAEMLSAMREPRYVALLDALVAAAADPRVLDEMAGSQAADVMGVVMEAPWGHLKKLCDGLGPGSADAELHQARIRAKRVRYAAEVLTPVFGKPARAFARRAEMLQQVLGSHQDAVMAISWLRDQASGSTPRVAFTAGRLAGIESTVRDEARRAWPDAWADLRPKRLRFW
ncbi:MAG: CYTH and CHAD domain-containing protein [Actinomycetota bacterium]